MRDSTRRLYGLQRKPLKLADSHAFDLVLVNEYLPDAKCEDVLRALQKRGRQIPCIVMQPSAPEFVDFTRFEALGAKDIVCKHCFRQIVEIVRECLLCDRKRIRLPERELGEAAESLEGGSR